jgi:hypothetical protein
MNAPGTIGVAWRIQKSSPKWQRTGLVDDHCEIVGIGISHCAYWKSVL